MFPSLAARETYVAETNLAAWKEKMFKHFCFPDTKHKHMFPSLASMKTMLTRFQCRLLLLSIPLLWMGIADTRLPTQIIWPRTLQAQCMRWQFCSLETGTQWNEMSRPSQGTSKLGLVFLGAILENTFLCSFWRSLGLSPQQGGKRSWRPYAYNVWTMGGLQPPILLRCLYRTLSPLFFSANLYLGLSSKFLHLRRPNKLLSYTK